MCLLECQHIIYLKNLSTLNLGRSHEMLDILGIHFFQKKNGYFLYI